METIVCEFSFPRLEGRGSLSLSYLCLSSFVSSSLPLVSSLADFLLTRIMELAKVKTNEEEGTMVTRIHEISLIIENKIPKNKNEISI